LFAGLIGLGETEVIGETVTMLHAFDIAMVLASPRLAEMVVPFGNILTTASDMGSVVRVSHSVHARFGISSNASN